LPDPGAVSGLSIVGEPLTALVDEVVDATVDVRRDFHAHPELGFEERRTTAVIRDHLAGLGLEELPCPTDTGAVYRLSGGRAGRTVLLRADIDALPVGEEVDVPYRSRIPGVMHACGHDGHAAMLLGVASVLAQRAEDLTGRYVLLFQPAEELTSGGGARRMLEGGVLEGLDVERLLSCHLTSQMPTGMLAARPGVAMSSAQSVGVRVRGSGGHGALAGAGGNAVLAIAALTSRLPAAVEGMEYEDSECAFGTGLLRAGTAANVVPREAVLQASLRTFTAEQRRVALDRVRVVCDEVAAEYGLDVHLDLPDPVPAVTNDAATTGLVHQVAGELLGVDRVFAGPPMRPSDDIAEFLARVPGCHFHVGAQPGPTLPPMHHAPDFAFDEAAMRIGMALMAGAAVRLAQSSSAVSV